jgi:hypothetical protein
VSPHSGHIGRVLGNKESEAHENDNDLRSVLGNWDPKTNEKLYSNKLPMKILCQKAGFREADGLLLCCLFLCLYVGLFVFVLISKVDVEDGKTDNFLLWEKLTKNFCPGGLITLA